MFEKTTYHSTNTATTLPLRSPRRRPLGV